MSTDETHMSDSTDVEYDEDMAEGEGDGEGYERVPDDFESDISLEDATVPDHPVVVDVPGKGEAAARLVKQRTLEEFRDEAAESNDAENFGAKEVVELLKTHYESPSFEGLTARKYRNSPAGYYDPFFEAIVPEISPDEGNR